MKINELADAMARFTKFYVTCEDDEDKKSEVVVYADEAKHLFGNVEVRELSCKDEGIVIKIDRDDFESNAAVKLMEEEC